MHDLFFRPRLRQSLLRLIICCGWIALIYLLSPAVVRADGSQAGVLAGLVVDDQGNPVSDVEVELVGSQVQRQILTDAEGHFRFLALEIGSYTVTAEWLGLRAMQRELRVYIDKTTETVLRLEENVRDEASEEDSELVYVVAVAPLIDRFDTRIGTSISRDLLDDLPVERFYQTVALLLPGVSGGNDGNPNVGGSLRSNNLFLIDGVDTTDPTTGLFGLNLNFEAIQDVDVTTAAPSVEFGRASGAVINVATRSGGSRFSGSARWLASNPAWDDDYDVPPNLTDESTAAGEDNALENTVSFTLSGPLVRDHLGFFAAFESAEDTFFRPTLSDALWDEDADLTSSSFKLSGRSGGTESAPHSPRGRQHSFVAQYTADSASFNFFSPFDQGAGENRAARPPQQLQGAFIDFLPGDLAALQKRSQEGSFSKLQWNTVWNQNLSLTTSLATQDRRLERAPLRQSSITGGAPHFADQPFDLSALSPEEAAAFFPITTLYNGITDKGFEERQRDQGSLVIDFFNRHSKLEQDFRFGLDVQRTRSKTKLNVSGRAGTDRATGRPVEGQLFLDFDLRGACVNEDRCVDFDTTTGSFQPNSLFNYFERQARQTEVEDLAVYAKNSLSIGRWLISLGLRYETVRAEDDTGRLLVDDTSLSPRLGLKYDPRGDGKALLSVTWSRFVEAFPQLLFDNFVRTELFSGYSLYVWGDLFGLDCSGRQPAELNSDCWIFFEEVPLFPFQFAEPNPDLERSQVEEWVFSFERQLSVNTALRLSYIGREWSDLWDDLISGEDPQLTDVDVQVVNLPQARRSYRALQFLIQKRFANRWQLLASYTWSETEGNLFQNDAFSTFADFDDLTDTNRTNRFGAAPYDRPNQFKMFANYRLPLGRHDLSFGTVLRFESGLPFQAERPEAFGVRFLDRRGFRRLNDLWRWDLSAAYDFQFTTTDVQVKFEVFNVTDEQNQIGTETDVTFGRFGQPRSINDLQIPRHLRLSFGLRF